MALFPEVAKGTFPVFGKYPGSDEQVFAEGEMGVGRFGEALSGICTYISDIWRTTDFLDEKQRKTGEEREKAYNADIRNRVNAIRRRDGLPPLAEDSGGGRYATTGTEEGIEDVAYALLRADADSRFDVHYVSDSRLRAVTGVHDENIRVFGYENGLGPGSLIYVNANLSEVDQMTGLAHEYAAKRVKAETGKTHDEIHDQIYVSEVDVIREYLQRAMEMRRN